MTGKATTGLQERGSSRSCSVRHAAHERLSVQTVTLGIPEQQGWAAGELSVTIQLDVTGQVVLPFHDWLPNTEIAFQAN